MIQISRTFRYSGRIAEDDLLHSVQRDEEVGVVPVAIPPLMVNVPGIGNVPQYAPTIVGVMVGYNPPTDCNGYFMSSKFKVHNNCYNYATDIATNSRAQPGRMHGFAIKYPLSAQNGQQVVQGAQMDGLILVGDIDTKISDLRDHAQQFGPGHFAALMISDADPKLGWPGDYHWARCDDLSIASWSQKDGNDQVTNFDFAGNLISNPIQANWKVNQGPENIYQNGSPDYTVEYIFYAYMFVPSKGINII